MKLKLQAPKTSWTRRAVVLLEISLVLFWLGLLLQSDKLIIASGVILSYLLIASLITTTPAQNVRISRLINHERVIEEHPFQMATHIRNEFRDPVLVSAVDELPSNMEIMEGGGSYMLVASASSTSVISELVRVTFRGHYLVTSPSARAMDEFGLRETNLAGGPPNYLTVLPPIEDISDFAIESRRAHPEIGAFRSGNVGVGTEFFSIRDYLPGDELRRINWKASARTDSILSNEYEREHVTNIYLFVDMSTADITTLRWSIKTAASIATYLLRTRNRLGLVVLGESVSHVPIEGGRRQLLRVLDKLVTVEPGGTGEPSLYLRRLIDDMPKCEVLLVSPLTSPAIAKMIEALKEKHAHTVAITSLPGEPDENSRSDPILKLTRLMYSIRRRTTIQQIRNSGMKVVEVPVDRPVRMAVSMIRERPLRR